MMQNSVIPDSHEDLLELPVLADVATIGPDGSPQVNPVWFNWDGTRLRFGHTTQRQKYRNLQQDKRIAISIVDPVNPYRYIEIRGKAVDFVTEGSKEFRDSLTKRYLGLDEYPYAVPGEELVVVVVEPERALTMG